MPKTVDQTTDLTELTSFCRAPDSIKRAVLAKPMVELEVSSWAPQSPEKERPTMTATSGALAAPHNGSSTVVQKQKDAAAAARRSVAQLRRIAMRLVVRLTIYDSGAHFNTALWPLFQRRKVGANDHTMLSKQNTGYPQIDRLNAIPGDRKSQSWNGGSTLASENAPGKVYPRGTCCGELAVKRQNSIKPLKNWRLFLMV
jgi:hypothetical protein